MCMQLAKNTNLMLFFMLLFFLQIPMMVGMLGLAVATVGFSLASNYWVLIAARIGQGSAGGASW